MEDTQVVDVLNIALLEIEMESILLCKEMKGVEGLSLCFRDCWNVMGAWKTLEASEVAAGILNNYFPINMEEKWTIRVGRICAKPSRVFQETAWQ